MKRTILYTVTTVLGLLLATGTAKADQIWEASTNSINDALDHGCDQNDPGDVGKLCDLCKKLMEGLQAEGSDTGGPKGMPIWWVSEPYINLWVADEPVSYNTSVGPMRFRFTYNQRDTWPRPGSLPDGQNPKFQKTGWHHNWHGYVRVQGHIDQYRNPYSSWTARVFMPGGGENFFSYNDPATKPVRLIPFTGYVDASFNPISTNNPPLFYGFRLIYPDGSQDIFQQYNGGPSGGGPLSYNASYQVEGSVPTIGAPIYADFGLTERVDPNGNVVRIQWERYPIAQVDRGMYPKYVIDYDGKTNTLVYSTNGIIARLEEVITPSGKRAEFDYDDYDNKVIAIRDAEGLQSAPFLYDSTTGYLTTVTTPYGQTGFEYVEAEPSQNGFTVGTMGGTNRVNRAIRVTHPDEKKELFLYRHDSSNVGIPASYSNAPTNTPINRLDTGVSADPRGKAYLRNSYHWTRKQYGDDIPTDLSTMTVTQYNRASMTHWLAADDGNWVSGVASISREASPDGSEAGHMVWYDHTTKPAGTNWLVGTNSQRAVVCENLPDGSVRYYYQTFTSFGSPLSVTTTYTKPDGTRGTRTSNFTYNTYPETASCYGDGILTRTLNWNREYLSKVTGFDGDLLVGLTTPSTVQRGRRYFGSSGYDILDVTNVWYSYPTVTLTNAVGERRTIVRNTRGQVLKVTMPNLTSVTNVLDTNGFVCKVISLDGSGTPFSTNCYQFVNGGLASITNALGARIAYTRDNLDRITNVSFQDSSTKQIIYDKLYPTAIKDREGNWVHLFYNAMGDLTNVVDQLGKETKLTYCSCSSLESVTDAQQAATYYLRDNNGRITHVLGSDNFSITFSRRANGQLYNLSDSAGRSFNYYYNNQGLLTCISNVSGHLFKAVYDKYDRPIYVWNPYNSQTNTYDNLGRLRTTTYGNRAYAENIYSTNGICVQKTANDEHYPTYFGYDATGRLRWLTNAAGDYAQCDINAAGLVTRLVDFRGKSTSWGYNSFGQITHETNHAQICVVSNVYTTSGRLWKHWTLEKGTVQATYDPRGLMTNLAYPSFTVEAVYDELKRLTSIADTSTGSKLTHSFVYTNLAAFTSALRSEDGPFANDKVEYTYRPTRLLDHFSILGATTWNQQFDYDTKARLRTITAPGQGDYTFTYDEPGSRLARIDYPLAGLSKSNAYQPETGWLKQTAMYLGAANLDTVTADTFNKVGNITQKSVNYDDLGPSTYAFRNNYAYDALGQLTNAIGTTSTGTSRQYDKFAYAYDKAGNLFVRTNNALIQTFTSDDLNQLSTISRSGSFTFLGSEKKFSTWATINGGPAAQFADGAFYNLLGISLTDGWNTFEVVIGNNGRAPETNVITQYLPAAVTIAYDRNQNLTNNGLLTFEYDDADRLKRITKANAWKTEFTYDGLNRRRTQLDYTWSSGWSTPTETRYIRGGGIDVLQERDGQNNVKVTYTRGAGLLARQDSEKGTGYYKTDLNGNVTSIIDTNGIAKARYAYDPYGNLIAKTGPWADRNTYRFSSKEVHANSGTYYYGYRFYDPNLQRWLNRDPIGLAGGLNMHGFVGNDPINYVDYLGLEFSYFYGDNSFGYPAGSVPYLAGETTGENVVAGLYNALPLLNNTISLPFVMADDVIKDVGSFATWATGDPQVGDGVKNLLRLALLRGLCKTPSAPRTVAAEAAASIGHDVPWAQMTQAQRNALKHSYMRHGKELGLPNWSESNAAALQEQFNNVVGHIRQNGTQLPGPIYKPWNGQSVKVNFFEGEFHGTKYYYYEDAASGTFISAGKAR